MPKSLPAALLFAAATLVPAGPAFAFDGVVASIKPIHSLVAGVMRGVGEPELIVKGAASPHTYALRPSDAAALERAKLVFWVGPDMEAFLGKALDSLAGQARVIGLAEADGLKLLPPREGGTFEAHSHDADGQGEAEHAEASHDDDGHDGHDDAGHEHGAHDHDGDDHGHEHGAFDMHLWLDLENAKAMVSVIETALSQADPANLATYRANAEAMTASIDTLSRDVEAQLAPVRGRGFIVFHDAYQYFEHRFGVPAAGSITVSPEVMPGAERIAAIRTRVEELGATCVFAEPQFEPRLVDVIVEGTQAKAGVLDPEGGSLTEGPELYFDLVRNLASSLRDCLAPAG